MHFGLVFIVGDQEIIDTILNPTIRPQVGDVVQWHTWRGSDIGNVQRMGVVSLVKWKLGTGRIEIFIEETKG